MTADQLIDGYVADVVTLLPRRQRRDVAQELRLLLIEEVEAATGDGTTREQAARALVTGFGRPAEVALRYGAPVAVIDPADTRQFLTFAGAGTLLILLGAVLHGLIRQQPGPAIHGERVIQGASPFVLAWLGILVVGFAVSAWVRRRRPDAGWKPHPVPTDRIHRPGRAAALLFFVLGTLVLIQPAAAIRFVTAGHAAPVLDDVFAYDDDFMQVRGPVVLALLVAGLLIQAAQLWHGRRLTGLHQADTVHGLLMCVALVWAIGAGPVFTSMSTDHTARGAVALIVLVSLVDLAVSARREHVRQAVTG
jgi:hypothetical protein